MPPPFSDAVMEHFRDPRNVGTLEAPRGEGLAGSVERGVFMRMQVRVETGHVAEARYQTYGCVPAIAAGSLLTEWARGRAVEEALALTPSQLVDALGGLPEERRFCADLAVEALHAAVRDAEARSRQDPNGACARGTP